MDASDRAWRTDEPLWALVLLGWCATAAALHVGWLANPRASSAPARAPVFDLERMSPRDLRRLPGLGEVRALALVHDRWRRRGTNAPLDLEALPGIGPVTARLVREALERAGGSGADRGRVPPRALHSPAPPAATQGAPPP
jgi:hypothetical protein